jgi:hypothetical protein
MRVWLKYVERHAAGHRRTDGVRPMRARRRLIASTNGCRRKEDGSGEAQLASRVGSCVRLARPHARLQQVVGPPDQRHEAAFETLGDSLAAVRIDGESSFVLKVASPSCQRRRSTDRRTTAVVRHVPARHQTRPSRRASLSARLPQSRLAVAVVIVGGRIVGVWFLEERARAFTVDVQPFSSLDAKVRRGIADEAAALATFLGALRVITGS